MNAMTAIAAVPAVGLPSGALAAVPTDRSAWDQALERFRRVDQVSKRLFAEHEAAEEAWAAACPREDRYFDEYKLGIGMSREDARHCIGIALTIKEAVARQGLPARAEATKRAACRKLNAEADRIADEFMAYQKGHAETKLAHRVDELWDRARAYGDENYFPARDALMEIPAPDQGGLLVKVEIAFMSLESDHEESAMADAKRLLGATTN